MNAEKRCKQFSQLKGQRSNLDTQMQTLHDYYDLEAENINKAYTLGEELDFQYLYDTTSLLVADVLPAGIMNYLTPFGSQWMNLKHRDPLVNEDTSVANWYKEAQDEVFYILANSNFYDQAFTFYKSSGVYGTSNMYGESDHEDVVRFYDMPIKNCYIVDDAKGRVKEYYLVFEYTASQAVDRWSEKGVSEVILREYKAGTNEDKKHIFFLYIGPRYNRNDMKKDAVNMPYEGNWYDFKAQKLVEESGYEVLPAWTHRFYKRPAIPYGFSPAMKALMDVRYCGVMSKTELIEAMKQSSPALAVPEDAFLMDLDFNPSAVNTYDSTDLNKDKIFPIG
ncbi:hypothetical protein KAR91_66085, partial [Candidatus Pacearchaeota archaeon]|nr:hypothetical protein [Candidatus Pacearchaeota archaeon]